MFGSQKKSAARTEEDRVSVVTVVSFIADSRKDVSVFNGRVDC